MSEHAMALPEHLQAFLRDADPALVPLMERFYRALTASELRLDEVRHSMIAVLEFLASPEGRTEVNCCAVDFFLLEDDAWDAERLPEEFIEVLADMSGALHDTVSAPHIAENFDSTPEQLLARARTL